MINTFIVKISLVAGFSSLFGISVLLLFIIKLDRYNRICRFHNQWYYCKKNMFENYYLNVLQISLLVCNRVHFLKHFNWLILCNKLILMWYLEHYINVMIIKSYIYIYAACKYFSIKMVDILNQQFSIIFRSCNE